MYSKDVPNTLLRVHTDHLGTPRAVSQGNGATRKVLWRFEGDAFGTAQATNPTSTVLTMPLRMPGQYFDSEVGTSYNYFRDYDASTGRYVESDPIGLMGRLNTYGYVGGSPLKFSDPKGLDYAVPWSGGSSTSGWAKLIRPIIARPIVAVCLSAVSAAPGLILAGVSTNAGTSCSGSNAQPQECPNHDCNVIRKSCLEMCIASYAENGVAIGSDANALIRKCTRNCMKGQGCENY